jgi:PAS domain S-box-containing protein
MYMENNSIMNSPLHYINKFFWKAPSPMAITKARDGTYMAINEAFAKDMGLQQQEMIGQTTVEIGHITAEQRLVIFSEIKEKGYAQNVELEVKVKNNESRCGLFNSSPIKIGRDSLWLTVVTDISKRRQAVEARQDDILFKSLAAIEGTGVILIRKKGFKQTTGNGLTLCHRRTGIDIFQHGGRLLSCQNNFNTSQFSRKNHSAGTLAGHRMHSRQTEAIRHDSPPGRNRSFSRAGTFQQGDCRKALYW